MGRVKIWLAVAWIIGLAAAQAQITNDRTVELNNDDFEVYTRQADGAWNRIAVYPVKVDEVKDARHNVRVASMSTFDFEGKVSVKVVSKRQPIRETKIQPLHQAPAGEVRQDTLFFRLSMKRI